MRGSVEAVVTESALWARRETLAQLNTCGQLANVAAADVSLSLGSRISLLLEGESR